MKLLRLNPRIIAAILIARTLVATGGPESGNSVVRLELDSANMRIPTPEQIEMKQRNIRPYVIGANAERNNVVYTYSDSTQIRHSGGTIAWRQNNPGNLRNSPIARAAGAIGVAHGFAIFPDYDTGRGAISQLLLSDRYRDLTVLSAMFKYAPPVENDTKSYQRNIVRLAGVQGNRRIRDLDTDELERVIDAICVLEGNIPGRVDTLKQKENIAQARNNMIVASRQHAI